MKGYWFASRQIKVFQQGDENGSDYICGHTFDCPQMVSLDLSHCEIKRVAAKAFNHVQALEKLYLNNNQIKEIKQKTVETIKGNLPQSSNPFIISLFLKFLLHWTVINSWKVPIKVFVQQFAATHIFQKASLTSN